MVFARIVGTVVSTNKEPKLVGKKLLLVQPVEPAGQAKGAPLVAVDAVGAGEGEFVLLVQGSSARQTGMTEALPVDCTSWPSWTPWSRAGRPSSRRPRTRP